MNFQRLLGQLKQVAIALDQLVNTLLGGWADETLSARSYRLSDDSLRWLIVMKCIDLLFFFDPQHCYTSYLSEKDRRHLPVEYRNSNNV